MSSDVPADRPKLERRVNRLADERSAMFERAGENFGLSGAERQRLATIERELDECFLARRLSRAVRDVQRFASDSTPRSTRFRPAK